MGCNPETLEGSFVSVFDDLKARKSQRLAGMVAAILLVSGPLHQSGIFSAQYASAIIEINDLYVAERTTSFAAWNIITLIWCSPAASLTSLHFSSLACTPSLSTTCVRLITRNEHDFSDSNHHNVSNFWSHLCSINEQRTPEIADRLKGLVYVHFSRL